jgi:hypothetical protein
MTCPSSTTGMPPPCSSKTISLMAFAGTPPIITDWPLPLPQTREPGQGFHGFDAPPGARP